MEWGGAMWKRLARTGAILSAACLCLAALSYSGGRRLAGGRERESVLAIVAGPRICAGGKPHHRRPRGSFTILCKFVDEEGEPESPADFERLLGESYPGLGHYWREVSYGRMSLAGSKVVGCG